MESIATVSPILGSKNQGLERGLRFGTALLAALVLVLIFAGALVKSHEAGLSVPDWPTTYGYNMFLYPLEKWVGGIFFEHSHRLLASGIGLLTLILAGLLITVDKRLWVRCLAALSLVVVLLQGVLGGLTVIFLLPAYISIAHGMLAQLFFLMTIMLAYSQSSYSMRGVAARAMPELRRVYVLSVAALIVIFAQLFLGALMRHLEAGLALLDFPRMAGFWLPIYPYEMLANANSARAAYEMAPVDMLQMSSHLAHRVGAILVLFVTGALCLQMRGLPQNYLRLLNWAVATTLAAQLILGVVSVLSMREPILTSLHVAIGALLLGLVFLVTLRTYSPRPDGRGLVPRS